MSKLPILQKNAYLSLVVKDNSIWAHLAYTDHNAQREYILSDFTDLNPLKQRIDDEFFTKKFWYEYFDNLEKVFNWDIVDRDTYRLQMYKAFKDEGVGLTGIRVLVDENQKYFNTIFASLREFSKDVAVRVVDDSYIYNLLEGLLDRMEYEDILYMDMDLSDFKIYRARKVMENKKEKNIITKSKISWGNEYGVIDSVRDARFKAFLASDFASKDILNYWSNFVLNKIFFTEDPNILDILRSYTTIQNYSLYQDNIDKLSGFGTDSKNNAMIISGHIPAVLGKQKTLMSVVEGLEIMGEIDCLWDLEKKILSYGKSYIFGTNSTDIILTRKEVFAPATKVLIPEVKSVKNQNKVIMSGYTESLSMEKNEFYALSPEFTFVQLPKHQDKLVVEVEFKKEIVIPNGVKNKVGFVSIPGKGRYDSILVDGRPRPIVYGPDVYTNRSKLSMWLNDFKA